MSRGNYPSAKQDQFMLRLPEGLRQRIKAAAEANGRSMNGEIATTLVEAYPETYTKERCIFYAGLAFVLFNRRDENGEYNPTRQMLIDYARTRLNQNDPEAFLQGQSENHTFDTVLLYFDDISDWIRDELKPWCAANGLTFAQLQRTAERDSPDTT